MEALTLTGSVVLLAAAGLCEIAGGYVVWLRVQDHRTAWLGALGGLNLFLYGILSTLQLETASFGRVTVYGSVFVAMSLA